MSPHVSTGLVIFAAASLIVGCMFAAGHASDGNPRAKKRKSPSPLKLCADIGFFWISDDFRYLVAYPWIIFGLAFAAAQAAPDSWPGRVLRCDGDIAACLSPYDAFPRA